jgi:hypothetical protein
MYEKKDHYESWFVLIFYHKIKNKARKTDLVARNTGTGSPRFKRNGYYSATVIPSDRKEHSD